MRSSAAISTPRCAHASGTLEVLRLQGDQWLLVAVHFEGARVRAEPFAAVELDLASLWGGTQGPP